MFGTQSPKKTKIEEANKHLQLLHERVTELEKQLAVKKEDAETNESRAVEKLQAVTREKDAVIKELNQKIKTLESRVHVSQIVIKENEQTISALERKAHKFDELCQFAPMLRQMLVLCEKQQHAGFHSNGTATMSSSLHTIPSEQTPPPSASSGSLSSKRTLAFSRPRLNSSPTIQQMTQAFNSNSSGHFSISEDEMDDHNMLARVKPEKELYL